MSFERGVRLIGDGASLPAGRASSGESADQPIDRAHRIRASDTAG